MSSARAALGVFAALMLSGCAAQVAPVRPVPTPAQATPAPVQAPARPTPRHLATRAVVDSLPTPEALAVLASLPEPAGVSDAPVPARAPAPANVPTPVVVPVPVTPPPAEGAPATPSADTAAAVPVPVPVPTPVLGEASAPATPSAPAAAPAATPVATPAPAAPPASSAAADTCWRVQIAAPLERDKGDAMREMAQSQLVTPMVVDVEAGRYKVRSRECLPRAAAAALRDRALASGFKGVFLVAKVTVR
jgi:hypothetical protein